MITDPKEYASYLQAIQNSGTTVYTTIPLNEPHFIIDANARKITIPPEFEFLAVRYDHHAETYYFEIDRYFDNQDLSKHTCIVQFVNKNKNGDLAEGYYRVPEFDIESIEGKVIFGWTIENKATKYWGDILFSIRFYTIDENLNFVYNFNTTPIMSTILDTLQVLDTSEYMYPSEFEIWVSKIDGIVSKISTAEHNLSSTIEEAKNDLVETIDAKKSEVQEIADLAESQASLAKEQAELSENYAELSENYSNVARSQVDLLYDQLELAKDYSNSAQRYSDVAEEYADISKSYAVGSTGTRVDEDTDNSKYYYEESKAIATTLGIVQNFDVATEEEFNEYLGI